MISVCICTYNRAQSLRRTLASLAAQIDVDFNSVDVVIVDNNCTDETPAVVDAFGKVLRIRRVKEPRQGSSHARNRAVAEFRGDVLLFADDDVWLTPNWLIAYHDAFARFPDAGYFGGRILPDWGNEKPGWIGDRPVPLIDGLLGWYDHGAESRLFARMDPTPFGASFAVRRRLFDNIGLFKVELGTGGASLARGEETEFLMRARKAGAQGVYVGRALSFHAYDPKRLRLGELYRYGIQCGRSHNTIADTSHRGTYRSAGLFLLRGLYQALKGRGDRFRQCVINAGIETSTSGRKG
jgi:glycosyltransferase involved in cell wall biosynthesis